MNNNLLLALFWGALIGILGGLMGLGGAEFRLPVLTFFFNFATLHAVIINLIVSLVTVASSLTFRWESLDTILPYLPIVITLLSGSLIGAFVGAGIASRIDEKRLDFLVALLLGAIAIIIILESIIHLNPLDLTPTVQTVIGFISGVIIGLFSSMLGVAGGELIIPTIMLLYGIDIKLAGTLSLMVSLPTIIVGLYRYRNKEPFRIVMPNIKFIVFMALGSIGGSYIGKSLLGIVSSEGLKIFLAVILVTSAIKLYQKSKNS